MEAERRPIQSLRRSITLTPNKPALPETVVKPPTNSKTTQNIHSNRNKKSQRLANERGQLDKLEVVGKKRQTNSRRRKPPFSFLAHLRRKNGSRVSSHQDLRRKMRLARPARPALLLLPFAPQGAHRPVELLSHHTAVKELSNLEDRGAIQHAITRWPWPSPTATLAPGKPALSSTPSRSPPKTRKTPSRSSPATPSPSSPAPNKAKRWPPKAQHPARPLTSPEETLTSLLLKEVRRCHEEDKELSRNQSPNPMKTRN